MKLNPKTLRENGSLYSQSNDSKLLYHYIVYRFYETNREVKTRIQYFPIIITQEKTYPIFQFGIITEVLSHITNQYPFLKELDWKLVPPFNPYLAPSNCYL